MPVHYTIGFNQQEKEELLNILKDNPKWKEKINNSFGFLYTEPKVNLYWSGNPPQQYSFSAPYEDYNGKLITLSGQIYMTGIPYSWDELKNNENNQNATPTIGYFYNPDGILTNSARLQYYLNKENKE